MSDKPASLVRAGAVRQGAYDYMREEQERTFTMTVAEIMQRPTASPTTQLRQLMYLIKTGMISPGLALHINISGIKLEHSVNQTGKNPHTHTEAMTISSIIAACGYMARLFKEGVPLGSPVGERFIKRSEDFNYYPLHRSRRPGAKYKKGYDDSSVEYRGIGPYTDFSNMVKAVESTYWLSVAAIAKQRSEDSAYQDDPVNKKLSQVWDSFEQEWVDFLKNSLKPGVELLAGESIEQLTSAPPIEKWFRATPYNKAFGVIVSLAETNPIFRDYSRNLVIKYRGRIKAIIDESESKKVAGEAVTSIAN